MRKYLFNGAIISAAVSAVSVINATRKGPHDWRLALMWASWGISVAIAVGTIIEDQKTPGDPAFQLVDS
ncbi:MULTISPECIES: hypothetical protein [unclassified Microcella]|uniref:hypothetical protein n=1 Tax=unclassified Microcella TaxID=2630066 RepID=UPI000700A0E1|nr:MULTISPECIES: hypothetical protein [unclassified Microcella]KQV24473.1 hypothetical protein ASC54_07940 [Yonghaparkia sp. Root332]KRF30765.1 hypothetical protein ASG83_07770 [Yonghaparkia sp. Soil809]MDO8337067.1 hypothetical protein [Microcella sp.]